MFERALADMGRYIGVIRNLSLSTVDRSSIRSHEFTSYTPRCCTVRASFLSSMLALEYDPPLIQDDGSVWFAAATLVADGQSG